MICIAPERKLRVLHCIPSLDLAYGGPSQSTASLISAIAARGDVAITLFYAQGGTEPQINPGITRLNAPMWLRRFWIPGKSARTRLRSAIRQAEVVHLHSYWNIFAALVLAEARRMGRPVVLSPRGCLHRHAMSHSSYRLKKVFRLLLGNRQLAHVAGFHFQSEEEAQSSFTGDRRAPARAIIVDNGVEIGDPSKDADTTRARLLGSDSKRVNLLFLGRLNRIKGIDLQIDALKLICDAGADAVLHLAGPDDGELANLIARAEQCGVAERLRVLGPIYADEKALWLRAVDVVLMSSEFENNSNVALEVMAAEGILVATDSSIGPAAAESGAMIRVTRSAQAMAEGVQSVISMPDGGQWLRKAARKFVATHHNWDIRAARMTDFYRSLA